MKQILIFIMFAALLCWLMFAPVYKHILIVRQAVLQKEVDLLLEIGANASHGYISDSMITESKQRLTDHGFQAADLIYAVEASDGGEAMNPSNPLLRGAGLKLKISYPYGHMLDIDRLVGISPPVGSSHISAAGMKMSEFVP